MSWDGLLALGEALTLIGPVIILRNKDSFVPRYSSGSLAVALSLMVVALYGLNAPIGAGMTALVVILWWVIFAIRGTKHSNVELPGLK
jgi:hypothetical protein